MVDVKIYTPEEIDDNSFPQEDSNFSFATTTPKSGDAQLPTKINEQYVPTKKVAIELLSSSLNTKSKKILAEFEFTQSGSIQIGKYENGVSGDIRLTPNGITARNTSGLTTFNLDGDTGDATFAGTIQAGTVVTGTVAVGNNNVIIDGDNSRIVVYDENGVPVILIGYQENGF